MVAPIEGFLNTEFVHCEDCGKEIYKVAAIVVGPEHYCPDCWEFYSGDKR